MDLEDAGGSAAERDEQLPHGVRDAGKDGPIIAFVAALGRE